MEKALVEINGGAWDGCVFEIELDPSTGEPPGEFQISDDGLTLLSYLGRVIGQRYGTPTPTPTLNDYVAYDYDEDDVFPRECPGAS